MACFKSLATEWVSGEVVPVQMSTEMSSLTSKDDLQFTVSKTSLSFETYIVLHIKTTLKALKVYSKGRI